MLYEVITQTICYEQYRNSPSHNSFTELQPITIKGLGVVGSKIPIVVLINNNTHSMGNVITSYSIHYTKLYEVAPMTEIPAVIGQ